MKANFASAMRDSHILPPAIGTGLILLVPLVMSVLDRGKAEGDGWHWGPGDFIVMGALLFGAGLMYELLARKARRPSQRAAIGSGIAFAVIAIWIELAVDGVSQLAKFLLG